MAYALENLTSPGIFIKEEVRKTGGLDIIGIPGDDSDETIALDIEGKIRTFVIDLVKVDTPANLKTFATGTLAVLIPADQTDTITWTSDIWGDIEVKVDSIDAIYEAGKPRLLFYTIKLVEASTIG